MAEDDGTKASFSTAEHLKWVGIGVTALWLAAIIAYVIISWSKTTALEPNEVGDFLSGAFAPLAFFWLVLGFFQQGAELRNSGQALWLQGEELRNSVEQQRDLVKVTREQLAFESNRLAQDRQEMWRKSQPDLDLSTGGYSQSGKHLDLGFLLTNHGRPCTRLVISFNGRISDMKSDVLHPGDHKRFQIPSDTETEENIEIRVAYLDEMLRPNSCSFTIKGIFPNVQIDRTLAENTSP